MNDLQTIAIRLKVFEPNFKLDINGGFEEKYHSFRCSNAILHKKKNQRTQKQKKKTKTAYYNRVLRTFYSLHFELQFHAGSVALQLTLKSHKFNICDFHKLCPHINSYNQSCLIYVNLAILCRIAHLIKHIKAIFSKSYTKINKR